MNEIIEKLERAIESNDKELIRIAIRETGIVHMLNHTIKKEFNTPLFRVRPRSMDSFPFNRIENYSYAPSPSEGRCNESGCPLLYTSLDSKTAVYEMIRENQRGSNICLSLWFPRKEINCLVFLFDPSEIDDEYTKYLHSVIIENLEKDNVKFRDYLPLYEWVSSQFMGDNYNFSSVLCNELFSELEIDGILYPSYAGKSHGLNLVFSKDFADHHIEMKGIFSFKIHDWSFPSEITYLYQNHIHINNDGTVSMTRVEYDEVAPHIKESRIREIKTTGKSINFVHSFAMN